jgi:hypothetical protein
MADALITIQMEGIPEDGGDVRLGEFIEELNAVKNALKRTERLVVKSDAQAVDYKIVNLSHSSPATVTVAITSRDPVYRDTPRRISRRFTSALEMVRRSHRYAERLDSKTLEAFQGITAPTKKHISRITVTGERNQSVQIDKQFERSLSRLLEGDESERDEIVGRVERVDIHNKNQFDIYPIIGATRIRCNAPSRLHGDVVNAVGRIVSVDGWALYRKDSQFPYAMKVEGIELHEKDENLPKMSDLHGIAPDATGGILPEDFIRELRDAYW